MGTTGTSSLPYDPMDALRCVRISIRHAWLTSLFLATDEAADHDYRVGMPTGHEPEPGRKTPAKGVHILGQNNTIVFLTVCTHQGSRWLNQTWVREALHDIWKNEATAWCVGDYLLMPDHLHLFCSPQSLTFSIESWIRFWKHRMSVRHPSAGRWQRCAFHHRLRTPDQYRFKWHYVQNNPVRARLVGSSNDWPYRGRVFDLIY